MANTTKDEQKYCQRGDKIVKKEIKKVPKFDPLGSNLQHKETKIFFCLCENKIMSTVFSLLVNVHQRNKNILILGFVNPRTKLTGIYSSGPPPPTSKQLGKKVKKTITIKKLVFADMSKNVSPPLSHFNQTHITNIIMNL